MARLPDPTPPGAGLVVASPRAFSAPLRVAGLGILCHAQRLRLAGPVARGLQSPSVRGPAPGPAFPARSGLLVPERSHAVGHGTRCPVALATVPPGVAALCDKPAGRTGSRGRGGPLAQRYPRNRHSRPRPGLACPTTDGLRPRSGIGEVASVAGADEEVSAPVSESTQARA